MKTIIDLSNIKSLDEELALYNTMTEQQAMDTYNVDSKGEAIQYIVDYWV